MIKKGIWFILVISLLTSACSEPELPKRGTWIDSEPSYSYTSQFISTYIANTISGELASIVTYDIRAYRFTYITELNGQTIEASGLISIPLTNDPVDMLVVHHGTIASNEEAPSVTPEDYTFISWFASAGYVVVIPDYIGYGSSANVLHPYFQYTITADATMDMIRAVKGYAWSEEINLDNGLFISGYSEGGYATMALHKRMQEDFSEEFQVTASAPAAGGYNILSVATDLLSRDTYDQPYFLALLASSYLEYSETGLSADDIFATPYSSLIPGIFNGEKSGAEINALLSTDLSTLFTAPFLNGFLSDSKYAELREAFMINSVNSWSTFSPIKLYHGDADITVPYQTSQTTFQDLIDAGSNPNLLELITYEGLDHGTAAVPYFIDALLYFQDVR